MGTRYLLIALFVCSMFAHQAKAQIDFPTPNAASLGKFGQIPVSYFNGLPNISVPLYDLQYKDINIPIALQYHSGGNRPEDHPGWVGLGWNLQAGGAVTRIVNGVPDEADETLKNGPFRKLGYFFHYSDLEVADWATNTGLTRYSQSGSQYCSTCPPYDAEPDEFMFNAGDLSGSFYISRDNQNNVIVKVKSKENEDLKIIPELGSNRLTYQFFKLPGADINAIGLRNATLDWPTFTKFTIIRPNGMQYVFGGAYEGDLSAVDLTSSPASGYVYILPTTWYLTKIVSPNGYSVNLTYKKQGDPVVRRDNNSKTFLYLPNQSVPRESSDNAKGISYTIQHPSYLSKIITPDNNEIEFVTSKATQLDYDFITDYTPKEAFDPVINGGGWPFTATSSAIYTDYGYYLKLDSIKVKNRTAFALNYIENASQRLRLDKVTTLDATSIPARNISSYSFQYNSTNLPVYNSMQTDNWGYYNGKSYKNFVINYYTYTQDLYAFRSPDAALMKAEMLEKINYPTGGYTQFTYEPHTYSKQATQHPFGLTTSNGTAGGLRIKTIVSKTDVNTTTPLQKDYMYTDANGQSTGILSGIPIYHTQGIQHSTYNWGGFYGVVYFQQASNFTQAYDIFSADPLNPLSTTNGSHITYSKVTEQLTDGSKTEYVFSNHETMPDENFVLTMYNFDGLLVSNPFTSKELERGLLLSSTRYKTGNIPVSKTVNEYNDAPARYNDYVKVINNEVVEGISILYVNFNRFTARKIYTFHPYLKRSTEYVYDPAGQNPLTTIKDYEYYAGCRRLKTITETNSQQQTLKTLYKYPSEYSGTAVYDSMVKKNILSVVEQTASITKGTTTTELSKAQTNYAFWNSNTLTLPGNIKKSVLGSILDTEMTFSNYDSYGNPREYITKNGITTVILWGYNGQYPVAKIVGSTYSVANGKIAQSILDNPSDDNQMRSELSKLRTIPSTIVSTYTYKPLVGMTSQTEPNGRTIYYEYDGLSRLRLIRDQDNNVIKIFCYNFMGQPEDCSINVYTSTKSQAFSKTGCTGGTVGSSVTYTATATSTISQTDADLKAQADVNANGQNYANTNGACVYTSTKSQTFTRNNCGSCATGSSVLYTATATSAVSQADADSKAQTDLNVNGQNYANLNGTCTLGNNPTTLNASSQASVGSFSASTNNGVLTVSLIFYPTINIVPGAPFQVGTLSSSCYSSYTGSATVSSGGVTMQLICDRGKILVQTISQTVNAYTTINISNAALQQGGGH